MSSEGRFDLQFNEMLDEKLGCLLELPLEEMKDGKGIEMLLRNLLLKYPKDEISLMPAEMRCMVFEKFSDSKLIDCIIVNPDLESTAGYVMQRRKYMATLIVRRDKHNLDDDRELKMVCVVSKIKEAHWDDVQLEKGIMKKLYFSSDMCLSNYFCGFLRVVLHFMTSTPYGIELDSIPCSMLQPEKYFGAPAVDVNDKFKLKGNFSIGSGVFAPLLQWICPSSLTYNADPKLLFDSHGKLTTDGVEDLTINFDTPASILSDVMEKCTAQKIQIGSDAFWSRRSFFAVLTEHANSGEDGVARVIAIRWLDADDRYSNDETYDEVPVGGFAGWAVPVWIKRVDDWRTGHLAKYGEPGRDVTYEVEEDEFGTSTFELILH